MQGDLPFNGYMPLSKALDWLHEEFDQNGDVWIQISGTIQKGNPVNLTGPIAVMEEPE